MQTKITDLSCKQKQRQQVMQKKHLSMLISFLCICNMAGALESWYKCQFDFDMLLACAWCAWEVRDCKHVGWGGKYDQLEGRLLTEEYIVKRWPKQQ